MPKAEPLKSTTILLGADVLEMLRDLALRRARLEGGRVSQGATIRDLVRKAHCRAFKAERRDA